MTRNDRWSLKSVPRKEEAVEMARWSSDIERRLMGIYKDNAIGMQSMLLLRSKWMSREVLKLELEAGRSTSNLRQELSNRSSVIGTLAISKLPTLQGSEKGKKGEVYCDILYNDFRIHYPGSFLLGLQLRKPVSIKDLVSCKLVIQGLTPPNFTLSPHRMTMQKKYQQDPLVAVREQFDGAPSETLLSKSIGCTLYRANSMSASAALA